MLRAVLRSFLAPTLLVFLLSSILYAAPAANFEKQADGIILQLPNGFLNVQVLSDSVVRVAFAKDKSFFGKKTIDVIDHPPFNTGWSLKTSAGTLLLSTAKLTVSIDQAT